jgi:hypothetical protein
MNAGGSTKEAPSQQKRLVDALNARSSLRERIGECEAVLDEMQSHIKTLLDILRLHDGTSMMLDYRPPQYVRPCSLIRELPIFIGEPPYLLAVYSLGQLPPPNTKGYYNFKNIYPVDYECKRIYRKHGGEEAERELIFYTCAIRNIGNRPVLEVTTDAGLYIKGKINEAFELLKDSFEFDIEFSSILDFIGLNHPKIKELIHGRGRNEG